jgi:hypothetical protein
MAIDEEYFELIAAARDALRDLLDESEHDAWPRLRPAYGALREVLAARDKVTAAQAEVEEQKRRAEAHRENCLQKRANWRGTPGPLRRQWILDAVGGGSPTLREIFERIGVAHPDCGVYHSYIVPIVKDMVRLGDLERVPTGGRGAQPKWRYKLPPVSPDVAALEQALKGDVA